MRGSPELLTSDLGKKNTRKRFPRRFAPSIRIQLGCKPVSNAFGNPESSRSCAL